MIHPDMLALIMKLMIAYIIINVVSNAVHLGVAAHKYFWMEFN
jgi:hypothetical protein